jgi:hypothetical protein
MKAEHRKELQTNSLADFLGRTVRNVRGGTGLSWTKILIALVVVGGIATFFIIQRNRRRENEELWYKVDVNTEGTLRDLAKDYKDTKAGHAARFALAHMYTWNGIQILGDPNKAIDGLRLIAAGQQIYKELDEDLKEDTDRQAEAKYGVAVTNECFAILDDPKSGGDAKKQLEEARRGYEELTKGAYAKTAYGTLAARRFEQLNDPAQFQAVLLFYKEYSARSRWSQVLKSAPPSQ